ncbi:hypothetical protein CAPTEDRAFT_219193 [Capitella teleta]|uniref:Lipocalin/cytosolic fatty-acid binding domain-containing protein n=1 Tax=Capitella teleta TaxID=283909 RepID=R7TST5_CAPTE|nr:hypothetical protein CAPTEDRAFT_219193 [Capitella teleta]|eukprot:ELT96709.1 hypothetical protein CAPTEDRAFT_219193 [Capitella teleta]
MDYCELFKILVFICISGYGIQAGSLDLDSVVGRWYLMYVDEATLISLNGNISCVIADAQRTGETTLNVTIWLQQNATNLTFDGYAVHNGVPYTDVIAFTTENVSETSKSLSADANDVIKIGDLDPSTSMYEYLILQSRPVEEGAVRHLYVLCSSLGTNHTDEILQFLEQDELAEPVGVLQGDECPYPKSSVEAYTFSPLVDNPTTETPTVGPIPALNLNNLLGRWYQVLTNENTRTASVKLGMSGDTVCNIATFCQISDSAISLYEQHWVRDSRDEEYETGKAAQVDDSGVLNITLQDIPRGLEWVIKVGQTSGTSEGEGQLSYVVITDPNLLYLVVFAKDVRSFQDNDEVDVIGWLLDAGFTDEDTKPQIIWQDSTCPQIALPDNYVYPGFALEGFTGMENWFTGHRFTVLCWKAYSLKSKLPAKYDPHAANREQQHQLHGNPQEDSPRCNDTQADDITSRPEHHPITIPCSPT